MKKIYSLLLIALASFSVFAQPVFANDWRDDFRKTFEGTSLQDTDEKIKDGVQKIKDSNFFDQDNLNDVKETAREKYNLAKDWLGEKWNTYGKHVYAADGFIFASDADFSQQLTGAYLTVKIGAVRNSIYFSDQNGKKLTQNFYWKSVEIAKYHFVEPAASGKFYTKFSQDFGAQNFPSGKYYVWAICETRGGETFYRPVPVSKDKLAQLKSSEKGVEFTPDF